MVLIGNIELVPYIGTNYIIYNLASYNMEYTRLRLLSPNEFAIHYNTFGFDQMYQNYILSNDSLFLDLMSIMIPLYEGKDIFLLIDYSEGIEVIIEPLLKLLRSRYSVIPQIVNTIEDLEFIVEDSIDIDGLYNLDIDKERFSYLYAKSNIINEEVSYNGFNQ